jgi:hypothetical protein
LNYRRREWGGWAGDGKQIPHLAKTAGFGTTIVSSGVMGRRLAASR